jgi:hypothetical protein
MSAIEKDQKNTGQGFMFRSIDQIIGHAKPILSELGITIVPSATAVAYEEVTSSNNSRGWRCTCTITYLIGHKSGGSMFAEMIGEAIDYGDKSTTKAAQMAFKYLLTQVLQVGSEDPDAESPEAVAEAEAPAPDLTTAEKREQATNALKVEALKLAGGDKDQAIKWWADALEAWNLFEPVALNKVDQVRESLRQLAGKKEDPTE